MPTLDEIIKTCDTEEFHAVHGNVSPLMQILLTQMFYDSSAVELVKKMLLENGAVVSGCKRNSRTPLMVAATKEGSAEMLKVLLDHGANCSDKDERGHTFLMHAVLQGCVQNVTFLMQYIQDKSTFINLQNNEGLTALMCDMIWWESFSVTELLIDNGADLTIKDNKGNTPLLYALKHFYSSQERILKALINAGSDVNWQNNKGISPLMMAARRLMPEAMPILLGAGADINAVSSADKNMTAISFLRHASCLETSILCMDMLLEGGADSSYVNHTMILEIVIQGKSDIIAKLIRTGLRPADVPFYDIAKKFSGDTTLDLVSPLCMALLSDNVVLAQYFVEKVFLTKSDMTSIAYNKELRHVLQTQNQQQCLNFLDELSTQPPSLFQLAFSSVSSSLGSASGRGQRVTILPVPHLIKHTLLFQI